MKYGPSVRSFAGGLLTLLAASTARADYVNFDVPGTTWDPSGFTTDVNGVQITVTSSNGAVAVVPGGRTPGGGIYGQGYSRTNSDGTSYGYGQNISIRFSSPVEIISADLLDYDRYVEAGCWGLTCPGPALPLEAATYSVDGAVPTAVTVHWAGEPLQLGMGTTTSDYDGSPYTRTWAARGSAYWGNTKGFNYTETVGQTGAEIVFTGSTSYASFPGVYDYVYSQVGYGIRGITFNAVRVPELSGSTATTAVALLLGSLVLLFERRRSTFRQPAASDRG